MDGVGASMAKVAAFVGGGALLRQAVLDVTNFERALTEMRLTGELTADEMAGIRKQINDLSSETLQLPEDQVEAFKDMVAAGIDPRQIIQGLKAINRTATATFANVGDIGKTTVDLFQKMDIKPERLERAFNILHKAGKAGRFELKDMARYFPEVLASASQYGIQGEKGLAQVAAMLQIARRNRGEASEAATDMKGFFSKIVSYRKEFKRAGVNVFDFIDLKTGRFKAGKDIDSFFEELKLKTKGGSAAMLKAIGIQDYEASNFMAGMMKDWDDYKKIRDEALASADKDIVGSDFDKVKGTSWGKLRQMEIERSKAMKSTGSSALAEKSFSAGNWALEHPLATGAMVLGGYAGWKAIQARFSKRGGFNPGNLITGGGGVPVNVTNFPPGLGGNGPIMGPKTDDWYKSTKQVATKVPLLSTSIATIPAAGTAVVGATSIAIGKYLAGKEARLSSTQRLMELRSQQMVMGGGPKSYPVQVINAELARRQDEPARQLEPKNTINLDVSIDGNGRVVSRSDDMNTSVNVNRGAFFPTLLSAHERGYL